MGFLTNLGLAAGRNIVYGQEFQEKQADLDLKKQQLAMGQMAMQQAQKQQQTQAAVGSFLQSEMVKDAAAITDPVQTAKLYEKASGVAMQNGDFVTANQMGELAKGKLNEAKEQATVFMQQQQQKKESLSSAASDYEANPSADTAKALMQKAVDAGVNPSQIPQPGTPQWGTWVNEQTRASMNGKEKAAFVQKQYEMDANRKEKQAEHADNVALRQAQMAQTGMLREAMIGIQRESLALREEEHRDRMANAGEKAPTVKDFGGSQYQFDPSGKIAGDRDLPDQHWVKMGEKLTSQQKTGISRGSYAAAEVSRSLGKALQFDPGTTTGPFAHLGAHTPMDALVKIGSNKLTPAQYQSMNVNAAGLGNQIASLESALGGRMAAGTQQQHLQDMAVPQPGDSGYTAAYKIANAKELTVTALKHLPGNFANTPQGKAQIAEIEKSVPFNTDDVIKAMKKDPDSKKSDKEIRQLVLDSAKVKENITEAAPGVGAGASSLPQGWSVKEH